MSQMLLENSPVSAGEDDIRQYLHEIRQYPMLTPEQERELAMECAKGNPEAIRTMVNSNLRLVVSVAREYAGRGVPLMDLIQEGSIGLIVAAKKFDYSLEFRFSTYATKWIRQGVTRCLLNHAGVIRVPVHTMERMRKILAVRQNLYQLNSEMPSHKEIAEYSDIDEEKVRELMDLFPEVCSLDAPLQNAEEGALHLLLEDDSALQPQEQMVREALKQTMDSLLGMLDDRQRQILRLRFGMEDDVCHSLEKISKMLGVSKERVRQIEHQAIAKLKSLGTDLGLEDFLA